MAALLMGVALAADGAVVVAFGAAQWPALLIMPGTLTLIAASYGAALALSARRAAVSDAALTAMGKFMGATLSLAGTVMTIVHIGLLAAVHGLITGGAAGALLPMFMVAMGVILIVLYNRIPKVIGPYSTPAWPAAWTRGIGWLGVLCAAGMIVAALAPGLQARGAAFLTLATIPPASIMLAWAASQFRRRRAL